MRSSIDADSRFDDCARYWFDYDYNDPISVSAERLVAYIRAEQIEDESLALVGHSMGGLVARMAILSGALPTARKLIMLGTPNFGACRTSRSALLMQATLLAAGHISAVFRKPGILELTRVTDVMADAVRVGAHHADSVDYATVGATFFNESRSLLDVGQAREWSAAGTAFRALQVGLELSSLVPLWRPAIDRPHDGIVELEGCKLAPTGPGRRSEKEAGINHPERFGDTYLHIFHEDCDELMHVTLQGDETIIGIVKGLLLATSMSDWAATRSDEEVRHLAFVPQRNRGARVPDGRS